MRLDRRAIDHRYNAEHTPQMNGPVFAAVLTLAALFSVIYMAWMGITEPRRLLAIGAFAIWALPLFYAGGWAAGATIMETTGALLMVLFVGALAWMRQEFNSWIFQRSLDRWKRK